MEAASHTHAPVMLGAVEGGVRGGGGAIYSDGLGLAFNALIEP